MATQLSASVTGCSSLLSINTSDNYGAATATATVSCRASSLDVGDGISINISGQQVFSGYVKNVVRSQQPTKYEISCASAMIRAIDFFIVSTNPDTPYSRENIAAQVLVGDLMAMAGLSYSGDAPGFTFATNGTPLEVNLVSVYDYSKMVADLIAWHVYADSGGTVHFVNRLPFPDGGDPSVATLTNDNLLDVSYWRSDRDLRNRVVVYGADGIYAEAKASSPYLPAGFYKSMAAASFIFTTQSSAQQAADYNLAKLNRLTIGGSATIIGDPSIFCRDCVTVNKSDIGMSGKFFVYGLEQSWDQSGFKTTLDLRQ